MPASPRDPGLQPERTRLSWQRTLLAYALVLLATLRALGWAFTWAGLALAVVLGVLVGAAWRRAQHADAAFSSGRPLPGGAGLAGLALATTGVAAGALALIL